MSRNFVYLTGGLGNQIFQICAALLKLGETRLAMENFPK